MRYQCRNRVELKFGRFERQLAQMRLNQIVLNVWPGARGQTHRNGHRIRLTRTANDETLRARQTNQYQNKT